MAEFTFLKKFPAFAGVEHHNSNSNQATSVSYFQMNLIVLDQPPCCLIRKHPQRITGHDHMSPHLSNYHFVSNDTLFLL